VRTLDELSKILKGIEPRREVMQFAQLMELRLRENDWKSHWSTASMGYLTRKLSEKHSNVLTVADSYDLRLVRYAVDLANMAMMISDNWLVKNQPSMEMLAESLKSKDKPSGKESSR
jgi:hypothetical protein